MRLFVILTAVSAVIAIPLPQPSGSKSKRSEANEGRPPIDPNITWDTMPVRVPDPNNPPPPSDIPTGYDLSYPDGKPPGHKPEEDLLPHEQDQFRYSDDTDYTQLFFDGMQAEADKAGDALGLAGNLFGLTKPAAAVGAAWNSIFPAGGNPLGVAPDAGFSGGN